MKPWRLVGLLAVTATASYLARVNVSVAGALMRDELALDPIQMGRVFSAFLLGYALCQVPAGMLADRFGAKRVLALAALSWVVATAALAVVPSAAALPLLLGFRLLLGIGEAPTFPAAAQAISRYIPPEARGRANGLVIAAIGLGSAIAPPLVGFVMVRYGWRAALAVSGLPALAVAIAWMAVRDAAGAGGGASRCGGRANGRERRGDGRRRHARRPWNALLCPSHRELHAAGIRRVHLRLLVLPLPRRRARIQPAQGGAPQQPAVAPLHRLDSARRGGLRRVGEEARPGVGAACRADGGLIGGSVFIAVGARTANAIVAAVCLALATALVLSVEGPFWATMTELAGRRSGAAGGVMNMGSNLGGLVSPALTPVLAAAIGWENALHVAAGLSVVGGLLWLGVSPRPEEA